MLETAEGSRAGSRALLASVGPLLHSPRLTSTQTPTHQPTQVAGTEVLAYVNRVRDVEAAGVDHEAMTMADIEANPVRCPDPASADAMYKGEAVSVGVQRGGVGWDSCTPA